MAFESFAAAMPQFMQMLPEVFLAVQVIVYLGLVTFYGQISMLGYRGYAGFFLKLLLRLATGLLALVGGYAISAFIPTPGFLKVLQADVFLGGLAYSFLLLAGVYLATHNMFNVAGIKKRMESLEKMLQKADALSKVTRKERLRDPYKVAGIILVGLSIILAAFYFQGFPDMYSDFLKGFGLTKSDIQAASSALGGFAVDVPEGCPSPVSVTLQYANQIKAGTLPESEDQAAKALVESNSGESVAFMYSVESGGQAYTLAITGKGSSCLASSTRFCGCITQ